MSDTNESISKRLIDAAQTMMVYYATFSAPGAMIKEFNTSYANFCKLAEEVEDEIKVLNLALDYALRTLALHMGRLGDLNADYFINEAREQLSLTPTEQLAQEGKECQE